MIDIEFPKGSEWRKWDLHVHTPYSYLNNGFGDDFNQYLRDLITSAYDSRVFVVGITDYFTIEGYRKLNEILNDKENATKILGSELYEKSKLIKFLPNIELRSSTLITSKEGKEAKVNYHVIFSDELSCDDIQDNFLNEVKFFSAASPGQEDEKWALTKSNLENLGKRLKKEHSRFTESDIKTGMINACIEPTEAMRALNSRSSIFAGKFLVFVPIDEDLSKISWDGQGHLIRKSYIQKAHCVFSSNRNTRLFSLGKKHDTVKDYLEEFKSLKPCFHSSDAHCADSLFTPLDPKGNPSNLYTWVKADPTFQGLLQTLVEPEHRVFIGDEPPNADRVRNNQTKYIDSIEIRPLIDESVNEKWFDQKIQINSGLSCIIGNKGSGKSALADILGFLGNTSKSNKFSFLNDQKFRNKKRGKAQHFTGTLNWLSSDSEGPRKLDVSVERGVIEKVRYIPQNFLEDLCNELEDSEQSEFYKELENVIFSHIPKEQKLGKSSLSELLDYLSGEKQSAIDIDINKLRDNSVSLEALEKECSQGNLKEISNIIRKLEEQLKSHRSEDVKPKLVKPPEEDKETQGLIDSESRKIADKNKEVELIDEKIDSYNRQLIVINRRLASAEIFIERVQNLETIVDGVKLESQQDASVLGVDVNEVVGFKPNFQLLASAKENALKEKEGIYPFVDPEDINSLVSKKRFLLRDIEKLKEKLSEPQKKYQKYIEELGKWKEAEKSIIGDTETPGSLAFEIAKKKRIENDNPNVIRELRKERKAIVSSIFDKKHEIKQIYKKYYEPVTRFIESDNVPQGDMFRLAFDVAIKQYGFSERLLNNIHRGRIGSFQGEDDGHKKLADIIGSVDFDDKSSVLLFVKNIDDHLHYDKRNTLHTEIDVFSQLKEKANLADVYQSIFALEYLKPEYRLTWGGKEISQLSPGERGTLLLIFYLSIDKDDIPLIVDQPEENLDNQTVYDVLVPCIEKAKERRQIILVTHNPNLAVVCDAEQIICARIYKDDDNRVEYVSGSIENSMINKFIIDILEGTKPAFVNREQKYKNSLH